jgi:hypothetical protein
VKIAPQDVNKAVAIEVTMIGRDICLLYLVKENVHNKTCSVKQKRIPGRQRGSPSKAEGRKA